MAVDDGTPRLRAYYGAWIVRQTLAEADKLVDFADRMKDGLERQPEHFPGRWDRERIDILVPSIHRLRENITAYHDAKKTPEFNASLRTIVQQDRVIEPLSREARAYLGMEQTPTPSGPVDAFILIEDQCAAFQELLFAPLFESRKSFADAYFESEFLKPLGI